jgi:hypothetical protein
MVADVVVADGFATGFSGGYSRVNSKSVVVVAGGEGVEDWQMWKSRHMPSR